MAVRLYFTVEVTISPVDRDGTDWDRRAREPIHQVARSEDVILRVQVHFTSRNRPEFTAAGVVNKTSGHLVVLQKTLEAKGYTPTIGDRITDIPGETGIYYVTSATPKAHKNGRNRTVHINFEDRKPIK